MAPAAHAYVYCSVADIDDLLSNDGTTGRVDDNADGIQSTLERGRVTRAINVATGRCNLYLAVRYPQADLAQSWIVNDWATIIAAYWLACRRGNPAMASLKELYDQVIADMTLIRDGTFNLPDVATRSAGFPAWSNINVSVYYGLRKARVERPLSERRSTVDYPQNRDIGADYTVEPN